MKKEKSLIEKSKEVLTLEVVTNYKGRKSFYKIQRAKTKKDLANIECRSGVEVEKSNSLIKESLTKKTYQTEEKFEKAIQRIQRILKKSVFTVEKKPTKKAEIKKVIAKKSPVKKVIAKKPVVKKVIKKPVLKVIKKPVLKMAESEIKERIAESGKMTIKDITAYFQKYNGQFDINELKSIAKIMIKEAKKNI